MTCVAAQFSVVDSKGTLPCRSATSQCYIIIYMPTRLTVKLRAHGSLWSPQFY